eukprot:m.372949 g.372949  ORF g.372949 m.372949 type:complete len:72 (+) comp20881_c0_seq4:711-926(+)
MQGYLLRLRYPAASGGPSALWKFASVVKGWKSTLIAECSGFCNENLPVSMVQRTIASHTGALINNTQQIRG